MKNNGLKKIEPLKYNDIFSIHKTKTISKEKINNLPIIDSFSRNMNKYFINNQYLFKTHNKSYKNNNDYFSNKNQEFDNNLEKVPYPSFLRLSNYIKPKNIKNKSKIINQLSPSNKVNEVYFNINKTEYNQFNRKCFSIEAKNIFKNKNQIRLIKNKNKTLSVDELLKKEKEEFRKTLNIPKERNKIINKFSYIIYQHFFPYNNDNPVNYYNFNQINKKNIKLQIINNINDKKVTSSSLTQRTNDLFKFKHNTFFEMVIEKVIHIVEYKNQLNQKISINIVKNLLNEEIDAIWNNLNTNKNNNNCSKATAYESVKINKSTSTDDNYISDFRLNHTFDKYDRYSNTSMSDMDFEKKARIKIERKLSILNNKYGFSDNYADIITNHDLVSNKSFNIDNFSQSETENVIKSKRNNFSNEDDNNFGEYILSIGNNINENLNEYKNNNFLIDENSIFKTSNIKDLLSQFLTGNLNKQGIKQGMHYFKNIQMSDKKNIDFNDYKNSIIELYHNYLQMKEIERKKNQINQTNQINSKNNNKRFNNTDNGNIPFIDSYSNINNSNKQRDKKNNFRHKLSYNMPFDDFYKHINYDSEFESFMNELGGYYSFGEKKNTKEILKKIKESKELHNYLHNNPIVKKNKSNNNNSIRSLFTTNNKGLLNKAIEKLNKDKAKNKNNNSNNEDIINNNKSNLLINEDEKNKKIKDLSNETKEIENENKDKEKKDNVIESPRKKNKEKKFDFSKSDNLNELEKEFLKQTNNLNDLSEEEKKEILKYLNEIDSIMESGASNIYTKIKINNLHYLIEKKISNLLNKGVIKQDSKIKGSKDIFKLLKNKNFYEKQRKVIEEKQEEEEKEKESESEIHIIVDSSDNKVDIESIFIKEKRRSHSVDITKFKAYYKLYHNLLFKKIKHKKKFLKSFSARKKFGRGDWKLFMKKRFKKNKKTKKSVPFKKKKRNILESKFRNSLMIDDFKDVIPVKEIYEEDEEIKQFQEDEKRKQLRQESIDKKMNDFFKKIQRLKNSDITDFEKELEMLVNEQLERVDYSKEKENEFRRNNFVQDFDLTRTKDLLTKKFKSKRMHYLSPIIFFTNKKRNNINDNK